MKCDKDGYPIAECYRDGIHWVVPVCPLCGRKHLHGYAGGIAGHRVAHCLTVPLGSNKGYVLMPATPGLNMQGGNGGPVAGLVRRVLPGPKGNEGPKALCFST